MEVMMENQKAVKMDFVKVVSMEIESEKQKVGKKAAV